MNNRQMELSLASTRSCLSRYRSKGRRVRARWWFDRMRQIVDGAADWPVNVRPESGAAPAPFANAGQSGTVAGAV